MSLPLYCASKRRARSAWHVLRGRTAMQACRNALDANRVRALPMAVGAVLQAPGVARRPARAQSVLQASIPILKTQRNAHHAQRGVSRKNQGRQNARRAGMGQSLHTKEPQSATYARQGHQAMKKLTRSASIARWGMNSRTRTAPRAGRAKRARSRTKTGQSNANRAMQGCTRQELAKPPAVHVRVGRMHRRRAPRSARYVPQGTTAIPEAQ